MGGISDVQKSSYFEQLVTEVNRLDGVKISLKDCKHHSWKDALAFYVEETAKLYEADQAKMLLEDAIKKIKAFASKKDSCEASWFLDRQIATLYEAVLASKIADAPNGEREGWHQILEINSWLAEANQRRHAKKELVEVGGINHEVLPAWYFKKYLKD